MHALGDCEQNDTTHKIIGWQSQALELEATWQVQQVQTAQAGTRRLPASYSLSRHCHTMLGHTSMRRRSSPTSHPQSLCCQAAASEMDCSSDCLATQMGLLPQSNAIVPSSKCSTGAPDTHTQKRQLLIGSCVFATGTSEANNEAQQRHCPRHSPTCRC